MNLNTKEFHFGEGEGSNDNYNFLNDEAFKAKLDFAFELISTVTTDKLLRKEKKYHNYYLCC